MQIQCGSSLSILCLFVAGPWAARASAQGVPGCPDVGATQVDARRVTAGDSPRCGLGIRIFGLGGGLFGPRCPQQVFIYPSHQECRGESSPGTLCAPSNPLPVRSEECECSSLTVFGTGVLVPTCDCDPPTDVGHVEDASTEPCRTLYPPDHPRPAPALGGASG